MKKRMYIMVFVFSVLCGFIFAKYTVEAKTIFIKGGNQSTIQNKIKQLGKKGGTIILRKGTYRFTSTLKLSSKITLKAKGKVRIISKTKKPTIVIAGGNKISIQGIEFRGAKKGPYISLMKARNVSVNKCTFRGGEIAISSTWGLDKKGKLQFQTGVKITNNRFASQSKASVKAVCMKGVKITGNKIYQSNRKKKANYGICLYGCLDYRINDNSIGRVRIPVCAGKQEYRDKKRKKKSQRSTISNIEIARTADNTVYDTSHYYSVIRNGKEERICYYYSKGTKRLTVSPSSKPYREQFTNMKEYGKNTKDYFVLKAAMRQLEAAGGGTLTVKAGTYDISNAVCVPSNVNVILQNGVVLRKVKAKYRYSLDNPKVMFLVVPPSKAGGRDTVGNYGGSHHVTIQGYGNVVMDCRYIDPARAIDIGHAKNVTIRGIHFRNEYASHLMEINSSKYVLVENCVFDGFKPENMTCSRTEKEFINIDYADVSVFGHLWSKSDKIICQDVVIRNNTFCNGGTAIGSHTNCTVGGKQKYHKNVTITGNTFTKMLNAGIRMMNWKNPVVTGNRFTENGFDKIYGDNYYGIYLEGVIEPTVTGNSFSKCRYPFVINWTMGDGSTCIISEASLQAMKNNAVDCLRNWFEIRKDGVRYPYYFES